MIKIRRLPINVSNLAARISLLLLCSCIFVNFLMIWETVESKVHFIFDNPDIDEFDKRFHGYPEILKRYMRFMNENLAGDAVLLLPPPEKSFALYVSHPILVRYLLGQRRIIVAEGIDTASDLEKLLDSSQITHIALARGRYRLRHVPYHVQIQEVETDRQWIETVSRLRLPAFFMPEQMSFRVKNFNLSFTDDPSIMAKFALHNGDLTVENMEKNITYSDGIGCLEVSADYSSDIAVMEPECRWVMNVDILTKDTGTLSAEVKSSIPESISLFALVSEEGKNIMLRSDSNVRLDLWDKLEIDIPAHVRISTIGLCIKPLGWGYIKR